MATSQARPTKIEECEDVFLECRDFGHSWKWITDFLPQTFGRSKKPTSMTRVVQCTRCKGKRHDSYALPTMESTGSKYFHAHGYLLVAKSGRVSVAQTRREILARQKRGTWRGNNG